MEVKKGIGVSPGVVISTAVVLDAEDLLIPKRHIATLNDLTTAEAPLIGRMTMAAQCVAIQEGIAQRGYRLVFNCNADAGQTVFHIHLHLLGGRPLDWPPG